MSQETEIPWCNSTWNWAMGCTKVSPGCAYCYAEESLPAKFQGIKWGDAAERRIASDATFNAPLRWNKKPWVCDGCGEAFQTKDEATGTWNAKACKEGATVHRRRVFSLSLGDWLDRKIPAQVRARAMAIIHRCQDIDFLLCTKRPELFQDLAEAAQDWHFDHGDRNVTGWIQDWRKHGIYPKNVWVIASAEDQERLDERVPHLLNIPAVVHGLSLEPLLGPIEFNGPRLEWLAPFKDTDAMLRKTPRIDWCIVGGESGKNARPCNVEWIRSIKDQCVAAGVPPFVKQLGSNPRCRNGAGYYDCPAQLRLKHPKGGDPAEWPEDLRVRQFPEVQR
jgi:protein gp37